MPGTPLGHLSFKRPTPGQGIEPCEKLNKPCSGFPEIGVPSHLLSALRGGINNLVL